MSDRMIASTRSPSTYWLLLLLPFAFGTHRHTDKEFSMEQ
jgi:hypothetical protein